MKRKVFFLEFTDFYLAACFRIEKSFAIKNEFEREFTKQSNKNIDNQSIKLII